MLATGFKRANLGLLYIRLTYPWYNGAVAFHTKKVIDGRRISNIGQMSAISRVVVNEYLR